MNTQESMMNRTATLVTVPKPVLFARRASNSSVVQALPQPGGADILREKKLLMKK